MGSEFCIGFVNLVDIPVDVAMLLRFLASARRGHLHRAFHIFCRLEMVQQLVEHGLRRSGAKLDMLLVM